MSDARLRTFEREAASGGSPDSRVRLLQERLRAGSILASDVELLAFVGDPDARAVLGRTMQHLACSCGGVDPTHGHGEVRRAPFSDWARRLERWGRTTCVRVGLAAGRLVLKAQAEIEDVECPSCESGWTSCGRCQGDSCHNRIECERCAGTGFVRGEGRLPNDVIEAAKLCLSSASAWLGGGGSSDVVGGILHDCVRLVLAAAPAGAPWAGHVAALCFFDDRLMGDTTMEALESAASLVTEDAIRTAALESIQEAVGVLA